MSDPERDKRIAKRMALVLLLVAAVFLGVGGWFAEKRFTVMNSWPQVEAEVVSSEVISYDDSDNDTMYKAVFRFRYTVDGREYVTQTGNGYGTSFRSWMQAKVDRFAAGTRHAIHYNPADPAEIEYNAGYNFEFFGIPLFCAGMGLIIGWAGLRAIRPRDTDRCPACSQFIVAGQTTCPSCGVPLNTPNAS